MPQEAAQPHIPHALIVDDNEILVGYLKRRIGAWPCLTATDLDAGLELARAYEPAVIALDNRLPDGLGLELIAEFKKAAPGAIVMMISNVMDDEERALARQRGAVVAWTKSNLQMVAEYIIAVLSVRAAVPASSG